METTPKQILQDAATLNNLMPNLSEQPRIEASVIHAENHGDTKVRANNERRIGAHLVRLSNLMEHSHVESRIWDSAVEELVIDAADVPESYWQLQKQIARDDGYGDIEIGPSEKNRLTKQLQEAQRTGLASWRDYLEATGEQYPLWFKFYAWDGMSRLSTFNQQKKQYDIRTAGTVAPYPQLNPGALAKVFDAVKDQGGDDAQVAALVKKGNFNRLYSHILINQKAVIPTPENPEDVHGDWKEYTKEDIKALTEAAEGTQWCIAGRSMAEHYTNDGGKFLLFHLQDPETGQLSPTAAASIRLDAGGRVVELSGLKGGTSQYLQDALVPTVHDKVKGLPGGERYLQAFEDKRKLIAMDRKFKAGEPFTREELLFLYEAERPIKYIDTYAQDPRPEEFREDRAEHRRLLIDRDGFDPKLAGLVFMSSSEVAGKVDRLLEDDYDPTAIARKLDPLNRFCYLDRLLNQGADVDLRELYDDLDLPTKLEVFKNLQGRGLALDPDELASQFSPTERMLRFNSLVGIGANLTPEDITAAFDDKSKLRYLSELSRIGANVDVERLLQSVRPDLSRESYMISLYLKKGATTETVMSLLHIDLGYRSRSLGEIARGLRNGGLPGSKVMSLLMQADKKGNYGGPGNLNVGDDNRERIGTLLEAGVDADAILTSHAFRDSIIESNFDRLVKAGADLRNLMAGIGAYYTSDHISELIEAGADVADIVEGIKPEPQYLLPVFNQLNELGANLDINEVVSLMDPQRIVSDVNKVAELGAHIDVNALLENPAVTYVYPHMIDGLLALGADPQKIADKILPRDVGYSKEVREWRFQDGKYLYEKHPDIFELARNRVAWEVRDQRTRGW